MEAVTKAKRLGGSVCIILPKELVKKEMIQVNDILKVKVEKTDNFNSLWGKFKEVKKSTKQIMKEIDEGEI